MFAISEGKIVDRGPTLELRLVSSLFQVNTLLNTVSVKDSNSGVVITKIFIRPNCNVFIVLVTSIVVRLAGEGVSSIGGTWLIFQEDVVLFLFQ
jgi:hypothetical protein